MKNTKLVKKIGLGAIVLSLGLFSAMSQAVIIASYEASTEVKVSSTFDVNTIEFDPFVSLVTTTGSGTAGATGSLVGGPDPVAKDTEVAVSAQNSGNVDGVAGFADTFGIATGYFVIDNSGGATDITGDVMFDITLFAEIFTASVDEEAGAGASYLVTDGTTDNELNIIFDSVFDGLGTFNQTITQSLQFSNVTILAGQTMKFEIWADVDGFAESTRTSQIPEPSSMLLASLAMLMLIGQRKFRA